MKPEKFYNNKMIEWSKEKPFRTKSPTDSSKHQRNDEGIKKPDCSILWIPPVGQILLPKTSKKLYNEWLGIFGRKVQLF